LSIAARFSKRTGQTVLHAWDPGLRCAVCVLGRDGWLSCTAYQDSRLLCVYQYLSTGSRIVYGTLDRREFHCDYHCMVWANTIITSSSNVVMQYNS
jgi:hypothetical protein